MDDPARASNPRRHSPAGSPEASDRSSRDAPGSDRGVPDGPPSDASGKARVRPPGPSGPAHGPPSDTARILPTVDRRYYDPGTEVGRGGQGRILRARDLRLNRDIALKELLSKDPQYKLRFEREALITAQLQHPAIVPVHEAGYWNTGTPFYAMKFVSGSSLTLAIQNARTLAARLGLLANVTTVADALAFAHANGVIHRDLKPDNIIVGSFGETIVIDWGLAKVLPQSSLVQDLSSAPTLVSENEVPLSTADAIRATLLASDSSVELTMTGGVMGTPSYMAPEQARGEAADYRSDVYALGVILYQVLAGKTPHKGMHPQAILAAAREGRGPDIHALPGGVPTDLVAIVRKATAPEPDDRYPTAQEFAAELRRFQTGKLVAAHSYTSTQLFVRWVRRYRGVVTVSAVAFVLLAALAIAGVERIVTERDQAQLAEDRAAARADEITLVQASSWLDRDPTASLAWLKGLSSDSRMWNAALLIAGDALARGVYRRYAAQSRRVWQARYAPGGGLFVSAGDGGALELWRSHGNRLEHLDGHEGLVKLTVSPKTDGFKIEVERTIFRYDYADAFKPSAGRYHTPVSYWNVEYHHGTWLQTSVDRPLAVKFGSRFVPVHFVGAMVDGRVFPGSVTLSYTGGVGNGRSGNIARAGDAGDVNNHRATFVRTVLRSDAFYELEVGGSGYLDRYPNSSGGITNERIVSAFVTVSSETPEVIAEYFAVHHEDDATGQTYDNTAYYVQVGYRLPVWKERFKPYARIEEMDIVDGDPGFDGLVPDLKRFVGGVRIDFIDTAALKLEGQRASVSSGTFVNRFVAALNLTF